MNRAGARLRDYANVMCIGLRYTPIPVKVLDVSLGLLVRKEYRVAVSAPMSP